MILERRGSEFALSEWCGEPGDPSTAAVERENCDARPKVTQT